MHIIKVGGNELELPGFSESLGTHILNLKEPTVVVHGGGRGVSAMQRDLGIVPSKIDGLRVTDSASLKVATMMLCGHANKQLVAAFRKVGVDALGLSGVDGGLLTAEKKPHEHDLGFVGQVTHVQTSLIFHLLARGHTIVIAPISIGDDGVLYNVNADEVAAMVAMACKASALSFVTDVPGVKNGDQILEQIDAHLIDKLERNGTIGGGMLPKLKAAIMAARAGVARVRIVDVAGLPSQAGTLVRGKIASAPISITLH